MNWLTGNSDCPGKGNSGPAQRCLLMFSLVKSVLRVRLWWWKFFWYNIWWCYQ